jgi:hypothetical protein
MSGRRYDCDGGSRGGAMKIVVCLLAILGGLLVRKSRELERLWLEETYLPSRAREPAVF